jgi:hypothetical protein
MVYVFAIMGFQELTAGIEDVQTIALAMDNVLVECVSVILDLQKRTVLRDIV